MMKRQLFVLSCLLFAINSQAGHHDASQEAMDAAMQAAATPGDPHAKLAESVGSYTAQMKFFMDPAGEPMTSTMTVQRSMDLGGRVMLEHWKGEVMGAPFEGRGRTGYDNTTKRYWSTWTDNMSTGLLVMYGHWDEAKQAMVYEGKGDHPMTGKPYSTRAVSRYPAADSETMEMYENHGDGEYKSMSFELTRN